MSQLASLGGANVIEYRDVPYDAANFTGSGSLVWTVDAGDHTRFRVAIIGKIARIQIQLGATSVSGTGSELRVALPFTTTAVQTIIARGVDNGAFIDVFVSVSLNRLVFIPSAGNWSASTNATYVYYEGDVPLET